MFKRNGITKFNNSWKKCTHGHNHQSKKEALRCEELHALVKRKKIKDLCCQVPFKVLPSFKFHDVTIRGITYLADFTYHVDGMFVIEDVKGFITDVYRIKKKLLLSQLDDSTTIFKET